MQTYVKRLICGPLSVLLISFGDAVRGMMYYRRALKLQAFLDMASESGKSKKTLLVLFNLVF